MNCKFQRFLYENLYFPVVSNINWKKKKKIILGRET